MKCLIMSLASNEGQVKSADELLVERIRTSEFLVRHEKSIPPRISMSSLKRACALHDGRRRFSLRTFWVCSMCPSGGIVAVRSPARGFSYGGTAVPHACSPAYEPLRTVRKIMKNCPQNPLILSTLNLGQTLHVTGLHEQLDPEVHLVVARRRRRGSAIRVEGLGGFHPWTGAAVHGHRQSLRPEAVVNLELVRVRGRAARVLQRRGHAVVVGGGWRR